ncbi:BTAD domain-containing putative transcriptional regulator [Sphaerisporangium flaviroseum]|uniref:BTAD domain-containing putative transcriptional regulator n=1 Tax=Sphaerisporangium flaviroseum TaxID=509199 RepID=A0ABP7J7F8_9ACTN
MIWFGVLGPLRAIYDDRPVTIPSGKQRIVLATLLLNGNRHVSQDKLIECLWDGTPARNAGGALQTHVARLRRTLGDGRDGRPLISTRSLGYVIEVRESTFDLFRFRDLVGQADRMSQNKDATGEGRALEEALALWRGPALVDVPSESLQRDEVPRLTEERLRVLERWFDVKLVTGGGNEIVPDLRSATAEHPLRERFWAQLMLALVGSGRQTEALEAYRTVVGLLREEVGIDPGEELRHLHRSILTGEAEPSFPSGQDPIVVTSSPARPGPKETVEQGVPVPAELPRDVASFVGRADEIRHLCGLLTAPDAFTICVLTGAGGVGKSALAVHVAHRVAHRFPDGHLYVNLHGATPNVAPLKLEEVLGRFLRSVGVPDAAIPPGADEAAGRLRSLTDGKRMLIVLDNAYDAAQVRPLLPGSKTCRVLVTSRKALASLDGVAHHRMGALPADEAVALLGRLVGPERVDAEPVAAAQIARSCEGLPLAICLAASRLIARNTWRLSVLADRLAAEQGRLNELQIEDQAIRATFQVGYQDLGNEAGGRAVTRLFRLAGLLEGPDIGVPVAAVLAGLPEDQTEELLDRLVDAQLLDSSRPGRYHTHDLLRLFARERAAEEETRSARAEAVRQALHFYLATARTATLIAVPSAASVTEIPPRTPAHPGVALSTHESVQAWVDDETDNVMAAVRQAARAPDGDPGLAVALAAAMDPPLRARGRWQENLALFEMAVHAADRTGDPLHLALTHGDLGWAKLRLGHLSDAVTHLRTSLTAYRELGDITGEANQLDGLANAYRILGRFDESIRYHHQALALSRELGNRFGESAILTHLGLTYQRAGRFDEAIKAHAQATDVARGIGDVVKTLIALGNLAEALRLAGDPKQSAVTFEEVLATGEGAGHSGTYWEAEHLWGLGRALHDLGESAQARRRWAESAAILHDLHLIDASELHAIQAGPLPETPDVIQRNL